MSEKIREAFKDAQWQQAGWISSWLKRNGVHIDAAAFVELQEHLAALRTHENGGQESEAVAWRYNRVIGINREPFATLYSEAPPHQNPELTKECSSVDPLFAAPPSAPAIEAAAIIKCVEVIGTFQPTLDSCMANDLRRAILALIPQDGRTALEEFGRKVAFAVYGQHDKLREDETFDGLKEIVNNLIGVPPLSSESVSGEGK